MNAKDTPLVSVLMTAYNREKYIAEAIESVLASTYTNFELIIVDDCSEDNTVLIAKEFEIKDARVKLYLNEKNLGQFANRNKAAKFANGKYIKFFDSDDVLFPYALEEMIISMEKFPDAGAGALCQFDSYKGELPVLFSSRECYINHYFKSSNLLYVGPSGTIFKRTVFEDFGRFDENSGILADTLLMLQIAAIMPVVGLKRNMFHWRIHEGQVTEGQKKIYEMIIERFAINEKALNSSACPLKTFEINIIKRNLKNVLIRNLPGYMYKISFRKSLDIFRLTGISANDLFKSMLPNRKLGK